MRYGPNAFKIKKVSPFARFLRQFHNLLIYILLAAAGTTGILTLMGGDMSADGRLVAWVSADSGEREVFAFDRQTSRVQLVSTNGGTNPIFSSDGNTIYTINRATTMTNDSSRQSVISPNTNPHSLAIERPNA